MTSNTPDHQNSDGHEVSDGHDTTPHDAQGVPAEPVQPASTDEVYDGQSHAPVMDESSVDHTNASVDHTSSVDHSSADDAAGEYPAVEREPYPIGATDAEPAPVTSSASDDEIVVDYGSAQEPEPATESEPPLTKPSPAEEQHPYPPQALGEPAPAETSGATVGAAGAAGVAATTAADRDRDRERDANTDRNDDRAPTRDADAARPVYVQAPTPPKAKGNRGFGIAIGILATLVFGALYLLVLVFVVTPVSAAGAETTTTTALVDTLSSTVFFVPVIVFFLAWVLLVVILTRASWWGYVIGGFFVGLLTYAGYLAGLLAANAFEVAPSQVPQFLLDHLFDAPALIAFVVAREIPIWFGVWVGKRGRAVRVRNTEAREEYERLLEAGPSARN